MLLIAGIAGLLLLPSPWGLIAVCAAALLEVGEVFVWLKFLRRYRVTTGAEGMVGTRAEVTEACDPEGRVRVRGETWHAVAEGGGAIQRGATVRVVAVEGLRLRVSS